MSANRLVLKNIYKTYNQKRILEIDAFEMPLQGIIAIVGWSGSGKSTLLNILSLIDHPDVGEHGITPLIEYHLPEARYIVTYQGHSTKPEIQKIDRRQVSEQIDENQFRRDVLGFIFQEHHLHPNLNIIYNIKTPLFTRQQTINKQRIVNACAVLGIKDYLSSFSNEISGGQAQRAAILRGVLKNTPILFGDELTNNLDYKRSQEVLAHIKKALNDSRNRLSVFLWVSHDIHLIKEFSQHIIAIKNGKIDCTPNTFTSFDGIMEYLRDDMPPTKRVSKKRKASCFRFRPQPATFFELLRYYFGYAYNDLFNKKWHPTVDFLVVVLSISLVILFLFTIFKINYASQKFLELKLSDPRMNFLEIRANNQIEELNDTHLLTLQRLLKDSIRFITPVYYATTYVKDLKKNQFRSNSNAITFRRGDPIIAKIIEKKGALKEFARDERNFKGLIFQKDRAQEFGYTEKDDAITISFNNFNTQKKDKTIPLLITDAQLPFNKTMLMREEFYIQNYRKSYDEEKPPIAFIVVYPENIYDTTVIKDRIEKQGHFEIVDAFKVKNKLAVLREIKKQTELFVYLSICAITIISAMFVGVTIYRSIHKKKKEIGVFLAYGMRKISFHIFYFCEILIIILHTLGITLLVYFLVIEPLINQMIMQGSFFEIIGSLDMHTPINKTELRVPMQFMLAIYCATYGFLTLLFIGFIHAFTSPKPIKLLRDME